jgi:hypothetical protein
MQKRCIAIITDNGLDKILTLWIYVWIHHVSRIANQEVCELRFCVRSCLSLLLLLFVRTIYLLLCNEI